MSDAPLILPSRILGATLELSQANLRTFDLQNAVRRFAKNGVNLMEAAYRYLLEGARPQPARAGTTYRWLAFDGDRRAFRALHARGELTLRDWIASLAESRLVYNVFAWDDPGPWLRLWAVRIARRVNRGPRRVAAALRQWRSTAS